MYEILRNGLSLPIAGLISCGRLTSDDPRIQEREIIARLRSLPPGAAQTPEDQRVMEDELAALAEARARIQRDHKVAAE